MKRGQVFRCAMCGSWRYWLDSPCHTCERLAVRHWIERGGR